MDGDEGDGWELLSCQSEDKAVTAEPRPPAHTTANRGSGADDLVKSDESATNAPVDLKGITVDHRPLASLDGKGAPATEGDGESIACIAEDETGPDEAETRSVGSSWSAIDSTWSLFTNCDHGEIRPGNQHPIQELKDRLHDAEVRAASFERLWESSQKTVVRLQSQNTRMSRRVQALERRALTTAQPANYPTRRVALLRKLKAAKRAGGKQRVTRTGRTSQHSRRYLLVLLI